MEEFAVCGELCSSCRAAIQCQVCSLWGGAGGGVCSLHWVCSSRAAATQGELKFGVACEFAVIIELACCKKKEQEACEFAVIVELACC